MVEESLGFRIPSLFRISKFVTFLFPLCTTFLCCPIPNIFRSPSKLLFSILDCVGKKGKSITNSTPLHNTKSPLLLLHLCISFGQISIRGRIAFKRRGMIRVVRPSLARAKMLEGFFNSIHDVQDSVEIHEVMKRMER